MEQKDEMSGNPKRKRRTVSQTSKFNGNTAVEDLSLGPGVYVDALGNTDTCRQCKEGSSYKHSHQRWCRLSIYYNKSPMEEEAMKRMAKEAREMKANAQKPSNMTAAVVEAFFAPKKKPGKGDIVRDLPPSPMKDSKRPKIVDNPFDAMVVDVEESVEEATETVDTATKELSPTVAAIEVPVPPTKKPIVNPYFELLELNPKGIQTIIGRGMAKTPPAGLAMPHSLYCLVDYINRNSPQLRENSNEIVTVGLINTTLRDATEMLHQ